MLCEGLFFVRNLRLPKKLTYLQNHYFTFQNLMLIEFRYLIYTVQIYEGDYKTVQSLPTHSTLTVNRIT